MLGSSEALGGTVRWVNVWPDKAQKASEMCFKSRADTSRLGRFELCGVKPVCVFYWSSDQLWAHFWVEPAFWKQWPQRSLEAFDERYRVLCSAIAH